MNNTKIIDSITYIGNGENLSEEFKQALLKKELDFSPLQDLTVIDVHFKDGENYKLQDYYGVTLAYKMLKLNPQAKILLFSPLPDDYLRKLKPLLGLVLAMRNTRYLEAPFTPEATVDTFLKEKEDYHYEEAAKTLADDVQRQITMIFHTTKKCADHFNPMGDKEKGLVEDGIKMAKEAFPSFEGKADNEILTLLEQMLLPREEVMKGQELDGVYCDFDDTLQVEGWVRQSLLRTLRNYEKEGKQVVIWTDGDLIAVQEFLDLHEITYPLHAKSKFAGAIVEIAIDDMDLATFTGTTKIFPKEFIQIKNEN